MRRLDSNTCGYSAYKCQGLGAWQDNKLLKSLQDLTQCLVTPIDNVTDVGRYSFGHIPDGAYNMCATIQDQPIIMDPNNLRTIGTGTGTDESGGNAQSVQSLIQYVLSGLRCSFVLDPFQDDGLLDITSILSNAGQQLIGHRCYIETSMPEGQSGTAVPYRTRHYPGILQPILHRSLRASASTGPAAFPLVAANLPVFSPAMSPSTLSSGGGGGGSSSPSFDYSDADGGCSGFTIQRTSAIQSDTVGVTVSGGEVYLTSLDTDNKKLVRTTIKVAGASFTITPSATAITKLVIYVELLRGLDGIVTGAIDGGDQVPAADSWFAYIVIGTVVVQKRKAIYTPNQQRIVVSINQAQCSPILADWDIFGLNKIPLQQPTSTGTRGASDNYVALMAATQSGAAYVPLIGDQDSTSDTGPCILWFDAAAGTFGKLGVPDKTNSYVFGTYQGVPKVFKIKVCGDQSSQSSSSSDITS